jgi:hypothetical protein
MQSRRELDQALSRLAPDRAAYVARLAELLSWHADMQERGHLLFPVLAAAAPGIEPALDPQQATKMIVAFARRYSEGIARSLYDPAYLRDPTASMTPWARRLLAEFAIAIMDKMAAEAARSGPAAAIWRFDGENDAADPSQRFDADDIDDALG